MSYEATGTSKKRKRDQFQPFHVWRRFEVQGSRSSTKRQPERNFQASGIGEMRAQWRYLRWGFEGPSPVFDLGNCGNYHSCVV
jgi:hypothetical protein